MGPVLELLASSDEHLRNNISIYSIPMLLRLDTSSLAPLLRRALEPLQGQLAAAQVGQVLSTSPSFARVYRHFDLGGDRLVSACRPPYSTWVWQLHCVASLRLALP